MARLGSQAKAGYSPTPESICGQLKQLLDIEEGTRILDPCCGNGINHKPIRVHKPPQRSHFVLAEFRLAA